MINYGDGNGNQYIIEQDTIEYNPIKPKFSSSGVYDGGDHIKKKITQQQYTKIASIFTLIGCKTLSMNEFAIFSPEKVY